MATQPILSERRQHSRDSILGRVENLTYSVLRKYGIPATRDAVMSGTPQETVVVTNDFHAQRTEPGIPLIFTSQQKDNSRLRKEGTTMSANLVIVHSNPQPNRKRHYPEQWLVYSQGQELQVHVEHDRDYRPHVLDKGAA